MLLFNEVVNGWRKTGAIFFVLIWTLTLILLILFLVSFHAIGSFADTTLFIGSCSQASRNVLILRLFINIVSTAVLTSSSFFLQILTAPTRADIDKAHRRGQWFDVGILSFRNLRFVSWFKISLWLLLAITTIPFHLLFNSSVYDTDANSEIVVVLANEGFVQGGNYSLPGVGWELLSDYPLSGYGESVNPNSAEPADFQPFLQEIDYIARSALEWERLDGPQCYDAYNGASAGPGGGRDRRHLVIILSGGDNNTAWDLSGEWFQSSEAYSPMNDTANTLWDAGNKTTVLEQTDTTTTSVCCEAYFSNPSNPTTLQSGSDWEFSWPTPDEGMRSLGYMTASYCLSEQVQGFCKTQVSNILFFVVFLCCLGKSVLCTIAIFYLWHSRPLSTLGDAVESFICTPDRTTKGMCTFGWRDFSRSARWTPYFPRLWKSRKMHCGEAVPLSEWLLVYIVSILVLAAVITLFVVDVEQGYWSSAFGVNSANPTIYTTNNAFNTMLSGIVGASLISNLPQLIISILYLVFLGLIARIVSAREWDSMSISFQPLRVTEPQGQQLSPWFLQIPLVYAIPLQVVGVILHVLASSAIYVYISETHSWDHTRPQGEVLARIIGVEFSTKAELVGICIFISALVIPITLSRISLSGQMTVAGNSSAAISAASHVTWRFIDGSTPRDTEQDNAINNSDGTSNYEPGYQLVPMADESKTLREIVEGKVQGRLKWGVVSENIATIETENGEERPVGHLSFVAEDDNVNAVVDGAYYAGVD